MADKVFTIFKNATAPAFADTIRNPETGEAIDLSGMTVVFRMRPHNGTTLTVDASAQIIEADEGLVQYNWDDDNTAVAGRYKAWWHVTQGPLVLNTPVPEYEVLVLAHQPGFPVRTGAIADYAQHYLPETIRAMTEDESSSFDGESLQRLVNLMKSRLFATICDVTEEENFYSPEVLDYVSKHVALRIIPAGIDFWANQQNARSLSGTEEHESWPNRPRILFRLRDLLISELSDSTIIMGASGWELTRSRRRTSLPSIRQGMAIALTPDPLCFPGYATYSEVNLPFGIG